MTSMTTTAAGFELAAMIAATPTIQEAGPARPSSLAVAVGTVFLALWLAATLSVLIGRWSPPVPADVSGPTTMVAVSQGGVGR